MRIKADATRMERVIGFKASEALLGHTCMGINMTKNRAYRLPPFAGEREVYD